MKKSLFFSFLMLSSIWVMGQTALYEGFGSTLPASWTVDTTGGAQWLYHPNIGPNGSGCAYVDEQWAFSQKKGMLITPAIDLSQLPNPQLTFKLSLITSNFIAPYMRLHYSVSGGAWVPYYSWGDWGTDSVIQTSGPCSPITNKDCATWVDAGLDLSALGNNTNIRFAFQADVTNGGFALIDDVWIHDKKTYQLPYLQNFEGNAFLPQDWGRMGTNTKADWQRSVSVGAFNSKSSAFFDNYSLNNAGNTYGMGTVWLDLSSAQKPTLSFEYAYPWSNGNPTDELRISYKTSRSGTWAPLDSFKEETLKTTYHRSVAFVPNNREWLTKNIDLTKLKANQDISFAIECKSNNGNIIYIDNVRFYDDTTNVTAVATIEKGSGYHLYPNPAQDRINILMKENQPATIYVYDITGRQMTGIEYTRQGKKVMANTATLSNGVYYIYIEYAGVVENKKVIINR